MKFEDFISNPGFDPVNQRILNSLNYEDLKKCCQVSKEIEHYIKTYCHKWKLLEKLQALKTVQKERGQAHKYAEFKFEIDIENPDHRINDDWFWDVTDTRSILQLFGGNTVFGYLEEHGDLDQLALFIDFIQAYLDDKRTCDWIDPIHFAVKNKRTDFMNLMVPTPMNFTNGAEHFGGVSYLHMAVHNDDIEMLKLLMKYSKEKNVDLEIQVSWGPGFPCETILEVAARLGRHNMVQLIDDVFNGKIALKDLKPEIKKF